METQFIDLYCERSTDGFWEEPLNAISNAAILAAAFYAWSCAKKQQKQTLPSIRILIILCASIALGSFLFHTIATPWAQWADIIPIWLFVVCFVLTLAHILSKFRFRQTIVITATVIILVFGVSKLLLGNIDLHTEKSQFLLNGSEHYIPAGVFLAIFCIITYYLKQRIFPFLFLAFTIFILALIFRSIDLHACQMTQEWGTHFLWHIGSGLMLAVLLKGVILSISGDKTNITP